MRNTAVFSVSLPIPLIQRVNGRVKSSGRSRSSVAKELLEAGFASNPSAPKKGTTIRKG